MPKKATQKKSTSRKPAQPVRKKSAKERRVNQSYKSFKLSKRLKHPARLPSSWRMFKRAIGNVKTHKKLFFGIFAVFFVLSVIFVRGFTGSDVAELRELMTDIFDGGFGRLIGSFAILSFLATDATTAPTEIAGLYQTILFLLVSLATIYALRLTRSDKTVTLRQTFYSGMYPLVPFLLVLFVIGLQLLPLGIGAWLFGTVTSVGLAVHGIEIFIWGLLFFFLGVLSLYMITSSAFALYIVTLPDMYPMQALRSARELVRFRRWTVLRKLLFLPLMLVIIGILVLLPIVFFATPVAEFVVLAYSLLSIIFTHVYVYELYRELL